MDFTDTICYDNRERGDYMATNIGQRIMERRQQLGWTQSDLAFKMGYKTKSAINKHEQKAYEEKMRISKLLAEANNMMTREEVEKIFFGK